MLREQFGSVEHKCSEMEHTLGLYLFNKPNITEDDKKEAFELFVESTTNHNVSAMCDLAGAYFEGFGVEKNIEEGLNLLNFAVKFDNENAMQRLIAIYSNGLHGVPKDTRKAQLLLMKLVKLKINNKNQ